MEVLTKLWDKKEKVFINRFLTKQQFENLEFRYCLPYEINEEDLKRIKKEELKEWNKQQKHIKILKKV